jgi:hypothetical protein
MMNRSDWNTFLDQNEAHALTLALDQRNLIADAGQHIDWLESRKRFSEEQVVELREQLATLHEAIGAALAALHDDAHGAAIVVLEAALKGRGTR